MADSLYAQYHNNLLSANPPPPPPPPPQNQQPANHQSRKAVFARLAQPFLGASRPPSSSGGEKSGNGGLGGSGGSGGGGVTSAPNHLKHARTLKYNLNSPILAASANPDGDRIVVAAREILRIVNVGYNEITDAANLRLPGEQKRHFQSDVKWGSKFNRNIIATAGTNGTICLYDVKEGRLDRTLKEHQRQVHRLVFNEQSGNYLLSASQDGTIKLWDPRDKKGSVTFYGKADAVRDIQFNNLDAVTFVAAFDNGAIQTWDIRNPHMYSKKINAHNGPVLAVNWHPDGKHCASGGRDKTVKVWDLVSGDTRRQAKHTITTMASISRIAWRPRSSANTETTQIATCAFNYDNRVCVWDFKRPYVPSRIMDVHDGATTGLMWRNDNLLWSCSKDSTLVQNDLLFAPRPINSLSHSAFAWTPDSNFTFAAQRRGRIRHHGPSNSRVTFDMDEEIGRDNRRSHSSHDRSNSFRSSRPNAMPINIFETALEKFTPTQSVVNVTMPVLFDKEAFDFFARRYVIDIMGVSGVKPMSLHDAFEKNSRLAMRAHKHRAAKSWKMLQLTIKSEEAAEERHKKDRPGSALSQLTQQLNSSLTLGRRGLPFDGNYSVSLTGGTTPIPAHSPKTMATEPAEPVPPQEPIVYEEPQQMEQSEQIEKPEDSREKTEDQNLSIPPVSYGISPTSSAISTDGEETLVPNRVPSILSSNASIRSTRPILTVDTKPTGPQTPSAVTGHHTRPSIDSNHYLPLLTSNTERSDPLSQSPPKMPVASSSVTTQPDSLSSPILQRQFSLISEHTSSSYGHNEDYSDSVPLPVITEEMNASTVLPPPRIEPPLLPQPSEDEKPWAPSPVIDKLLSHATQNGDVQFAAALVLLLQHRFPIDRRTADEVLDGYISLLTQGRHFATAALVRKLAQSEGIKMTGQWGVDVDLSCGHCGRAVGGRGGGWCEKCARRGGAECTICQTPGKGRRWTVCANCGHGGCERCMRGWFLDDGGMGCCPSVGCGCVCLPRD
ncbi:hypothetical protein BZA77DRAFT_301126 [Pyronema omphalodes]|nr:hypothetical protein BZA77DRAFT_301126 [Pyronema omphalodes]